MTRARPMPIITRAQEIAIRRTIKDWNATARHKQAGNDAPCPLCRSATQRQQKRGGSQCSYCPVSLRLYNRSWTPCTKYPAFESWADARVAENFEEARRHARAVVRGLESMLESALRARERKTGRR